MSDDRMPNTNPNLFTPADAGPIFGAHLGVYQGKEIIALAQLHGWNRGPYKEADFAVDAEFYYEATDAAEEYLCTLAPGGYYFGATEGLDWGLWEAQED